LLLLLGWGSCGAGRPAFRAGAGCWRLEVPNVEAQRPLAKELKPTLHVQCEGLPNSRNEVRLESGMLAEGMQAASQSVRQEKPPPGGVACLPGDAERANSSFRGASQRDTPSLMEPPIERSPFDLCLVPGASTLSVGQARKRWHSPPNLHWRGAFPMHA